MAQDRPTAAELVEAVRDFLTRDAQPVLEGRVAFHGRIAINALGMVERELRLGADLDSAENQRAAALLGHEGNTRDLERELASRIRDGSLDESATAVRNHVRSTVRAKLEIANPGYLDDEGPR